MIEYAEGDIENFSGFEFRGESKGSKTYSIVRNTDHIKEIDSDNFEFNDIEFNLNSVEPCY